MFLLLFFAGNRCSVIASDLSAVVPMSFIGTKAEAQPALLALVSYSSSDIVTNYVL